MIDPTIPPTAPATAPPTPAAALPAKPAKPRPDFPLFPHANGRWAKKVGGKLRYYGLWNDPEGAEDRWKAETLALATGNELPKQPRRRRKDATLPKPPLPYPDFPLFPHATGQWAKKIAGRMVYFGAWADPMAALDNFKSYNATGSNRPAGGGLTVRDLINRFLTAKRLKMQSAELTSRSFQDYYDSAVRFADAVGKTRAVDDLKPEDFDAYRAKIAAMWGPVATGNEIQRIRSLCKYGFDAGLIERPIRFGPEFKKPKRQQMRLARAGMPSKFLSAGEIRLLLDSPECSRQMKAMILLAINAGYGNTDVAELQQTHLDLDAAVASFPRPKTGIDRRAILWPETMEAIKAALKARPMPKNPEAAGCVFITKYGERWKRIECVEDATAVDGLKVRRRETDSVGLVFGRLLRSIQVKEGRKTVSLKRSGVNFYSLRHTFRTVAGETGDIEAVERIMGHEDAGNMGTAYREWEKDDREGNPRLRKVTDHVHTWLFGTEAEVVK